MYIYNQAIDTIDWSKWLYQVIDPNDWSIHFIVIPVAVGCLLISSGVMLVVPFVIGRVIDIIYGEAGHGDSMIAALQSFCAVLIVVFLVGAVANFGRVYIIQTTGMSTLHAGSS